MSSELVGSILSLMAFSSDTHSLAQRCAALLRPPIVYHYGNHSCSGMPAGLIARGIYESAALVARRLVGEAFRVDDAPHTSEKPCGQG